MIPFYSRKEIMTSKEIKTKIEELKNHKGLLSIDLENGRNYPGIFHTDHSKGALLSLESENQWLFVVRPGFGLGWEEQISGENIKSIKTNF